MHEQRSRSAIILQSRFVHDLAAAAASLARISPRLASYVIFRRDAVGRCWPTGRLHAGAIVILAINISSDHRIVASIRRAA